MLGLLKIHATEPLNEIKSYSKKVVTSPLIDVVPTEILASIANDSLRVKFISARRGEKVSACPEIEVKTQAGWVTLPIVSSAESYQVVEASNTTSMQMDGFYPKWLKEGEANAYTNVIWEAGTGYEGIVKSVSQIDANTISLEFYSIASGTLQAKWELYPNDKTIRVSMEFTPGVKDKQYSLGYYLFNEQNLDDVQELLLPMLIQRKRFPTTNYTLLQANCPTPVSLMQMQNGSGSLTYGVAADTADNDFVFPYPSKSRNGFHIRNEDGLVQPSIYGPLIGSSEAKAGNSKLSFRILVQTGDWYAGYRTIADSVFGWRDYRKNGAVSLTEATYNMIDLVMNDNYGGWWNRAKGPYQVESLNTATQSSPLTTISLYCLTGDTAMFHRRTLPTIEFLLSRSSPHFSPTPEKCGSYANGSMKDGPVRTYGTSVYGGLWKLMSDRTPFLYNIAFPNDNDKIKSAVSLGNNSSHIQYFDELLARYLIIGDIAYLSFAKKTADDYIESVINLTPTNEMDINSFFLLQYLPDWEGLLRLYEVTEEKRYLDAATFGARMLMTGIWTQPTPIDGNVTIHPGGYCDGDRLNYQLYKGGVRYRLGWPRKAGDTPERQVPAWLVSNVGLGFEQPITYTDCGHGGRMILQAPWAPGFLRLARYTGDSQFETYARNAVLGRWGNYPGYYYTTFTDLPQNAKYPYEGPDMTCIYYHHLNGQLTWVIDYLVSEASLRSNGTIEFPSQRQFGYAYFDNLIYGQAPGKILDNKNVWLWFDRNLVDIDNSQINYLTAHTDDKFYVVMMNESGENQTTNITFNPSQISKSETIFSSAKVIYPTINEIGLSNNVGQINIEPKGLKIVEVSGLKIDVPVHRFLSDPKASIFKDVTTIAGSNSVNIKAAVIQSDPSFWNAYIWSEAASLSVKEMTLTWKAGSLSGKIKDNEFPYEFSIPLTSSEESFTFFINGINTDGTSFICQPTTLGASK